MWRSMRGKIKTGVQWTRLEARVGAGMPDINGAVTEGEFWIELKVCKTKRYKTAGLWRPHQVSWQFNRSKVYRNVWNVISHPEDNKIYVYGCDKILDLNQPDGSVEPDLVLNGPFEWGELLDFVKARLKKSASMDECANA